MTNETPEWVDSPDWVVFITDEHLEPGATQDHGLGEWWHDMRARRRDSVKADLERISQQISEITAALPVSQDGFGLEEITFELGFSAEGQLGFIAKAGVSGSVSVTLKRK